MMLPPARYLPSPASCAGSFSGYVCPRRCADASRACTRWRRRPRCSRRPRRPHRASTAAVRRTARAVPSGHVPRARPGTPLGARGGFVRRGAPRRRRRRVWASRSRRVLLPGPPRRWRSFRAIAVRVAKWSREPRTRDRDPSHMDEMRHLWSRFTICDRDRDSPKSGGDYPKHVIRVISRDVTRLVGTYVTVSVIIGPVFFHPRITGVDEVSSLPIYARRGRRGRRSAKPGARRADGDAREGGVRPACPNLRGRDSITVILLHTRSPAPREGPLHHNNTLSFRRAWQALSPIPTTSAPGPGVV